VNEVAEKMESLDVQGGEGDELHLELGELPKKKKKSTKKYDFDAVR